MHGFTYYHWSYFSFSYFAKRRNRRFLTNRQYQELRDARIVLGTIILFYLTNILPFYVSFCHILKYKASYEAAKLAHFGLVVNSSFKFLIYISLSKRFRSGFLSLFNKEALSYTLKGDELVTLKPRKQPPNKEKSEEIIWFHNAIKIILMKTTFKFQSGNVRKLCSLNVGFMYQTNP